MNTSNHKNMREQVIRDKKVQLKNNGIMKILLPQSNIYKWIQFRH